MNKIFTLLIIFTMSINANSQTNKKCKCCTEKHTAFDFWIGSWTVTTSDGSFAGTNTIEKVQDNCVLRENWISATPGYTGTSNNFYNTSKKQWEQIWLDNQGGSLHLKGNRVGNQMILESDDLTNNDGLKFFHRITWTKNEDGTVRQYWETVTNETEITVAFDGLYKKTE